MTSKKDTILISGGAGALGQDVAKQLTNQGRKVVLVDIVKPKNLDKDSIFIKSNIADGKNLEKDFQILKKKGVKINGIVNTAAVPQFETLLDTSYEDLAKILNTKLLGYANVIKATHPYLSDNSSIVNIASVHAHNTKAGFSMYAAANAGVVTLTKAMAIEFKHKARVNVITPGGFLTPIYKKQQPDWKNKLEKGQILKIRDITDIVLFLLSDKSRGINASEIVADVGVSAVRSSSSDW